MDPQPLPRLTTAQAAARLRIRPATLYSYVSRGLIRSRRAEDGGSTFDALEVEELAARRRGPAGRGAPGSTGGASGTPLMVLDSDITLIRGDELYFRGRPARELAEQLSFEQAVGVLWRQPGLPRPFAGDHSIVDAARRASGPLGDHARLVDRLSLAVIVAGSHDPLREDLSEAVVLEAGRRTIATMVGTLPLRGAPPAADASLAARLWAALSPAPPSEADLALLDGALILCMDHDLAASTMAARIAASARAHPYAAVAAALGAFDSGLHGSASVAAHEMLSHAIASGEPERAVAAQLAKGRGIPGFGHRVYRNRDPRAQHLFGRMRAQRRYAPAAASADLIAAVVAERVQRPANLDLALAALAIGAQMPPDAGQLVFAIGRTAGWIAHIADEYGREPLRLRPRSRYTGREPVG